MRKYYISTKTGFKYRTHKDNSNHLEVLRNGNWRPAVGRFINNISTMKHLVPQTHPVIKWTILSIVALSTIIGLEATL